MIARFQTNRNMRRGFSLVLLCLIGFTVAYSWQSWQRVHKEQTDQLSLLAELESKFLDSYFAHLENSLRMLVEDLQSKRLAIEGEPAHLLIKRIKQANPDLANINIVRLDGQLVASAINSPVGKLPNIIKESSFVMGRDALQQGEDFNIGRPFVGKMVNEWIIPLRYAIRDGNGKLLFVIQATLPLARQQSFWQSLYLPHDATLGLLRDDGYLLSRYPSPAATDLDATYGKPRAGLLMSFLQEKKFPQQGVVEGIFSLGSQNVVAFHRLAWYPLTLSVGTPLSNIRAQWWKSNQAFYLLTGVFMLSGVCIYLWLTRRQADWEVEREAANQQIIEANHAKDQAEKDLLELELDDVKLALDHHSIVSIADVSGNFTYANDKFCEVSGYSIEELVGRNHRILNSGLHSRDFFIEMWHVISSGQAWHGQIRNRAKDGSFYWVDSTIVPFLNKDGKPYQYVSVRTDITAFIKARAAAENANKAKSQFLSNMSHELRTPLNAILGFGQLLAMQIGPEKREQHEFVSHMITAGNQLLGLINDLLDLSRIEIGKLEFNIQDVSIAELVESSVSLVASSRINNRIIMIENAIVDRNLLVKGDGLRIRQVLINLLTNAVKYNRENGTVTISSMKQPGGRLRIQVQDTGDGIASDKLPLLFRHFERLDQKHGKIEGAGIGLYVCKQLVEAMHGEIGVESVQGKGSIFWFVLPAGDDI
ncbi:MAG TPA: ATP-binding protein [Gallionellaceae bacterium]|nr:ATP-binding protein [Gallionellaceae bacterium]